MEENNNQYQAQVPQMDMRLQNVAAQTGAIETGPSFKKQLQRYKIAIIIILSLLIVGLIAGVTWWAATHMAGVNYSETYKVAKELRKKIQDIKNDTGCENVINYANSKVTISKDYLGYIEACKNIGEGTEELVKILGETEGVIKDEIINEQYQQFKALYEEEMNRDAQKLGGAMEVYRIWHDFVLAAEAVDNWDQADADLVAAAQPLIDSNNEKLAEYGETWAVKKMAAAKAYREHYVASPIDRALKESLRVAMEKKQNEYNDYVSTYKPNLKNIAPFEEVNTSKLYNEFEKLYNLIRETYQTNYQQGSNDCWALGGEVVCE